MRIYKNIDEAISETRRDLAEMGIIQSRYYQSQVIETKTKEILGYGFKIDFEGSHLEDLEFGKNRYTNYQDCQNEAIRRFYGFTYNLYKSGYSSKVFETLAVNYKNNLLLNYDYVERINNSFILATDKLAKYPNSRQQIISIWDSTDLMKSEYFRVPCSIYYHLIMQENKLNLSYVMRSSDVMVHFPNDITIAVLLLYESIKYFNIFHDKQISFGKFIFYTDNLHEYLEDLRGIY